MSSASVLHILEQVIDTCPPPPGSAGLMIGLGPGRQRRAGAAAMVTDARSRDVYWALLAVIAVERVAELVVSQRHAAASLRRGGVEYGQGHFPVMVALHVGAAGGLRGRAAGAAPRCSSPRLAGRCSPSWWPRTRCAGGASPPSARGGRARVIVIPGLPLVRSGPYRWFAHPNYVAVIVEGAALPLVGSAWITACTFTVLNAALLTVRLRCETRALAARRSSRRCHDDGCARHCDGGTVIDVLVVGGGPAGLATAIRCAQAGLSVTVAEPRTGPIDKACGEGLMPSAVTRLAALGVRPAGHLLRGIRYLDASSPRRRALPPRSTVSASGAPTLARRARGRAAQLADPGPAGPGDRVHPARRRRHGGGPARPGTWSPPTGCTRLSAGPAGWIRRAPASRGSACAGTTGSRRGPTWSRCTGPAGAEAYVTPVADDLVGVAILGGAHGDFASRLARLPGAARAAGRGRAGSDVRGAGPLRQDVPRRVRWQCPARRRRLRLSRRADRRGHRRGAGAGGGPGGVPRGGPARRLRTSLAASLPQVMDAHRRACSGPGTSRCSAPRIVPAAQRLPRLFTTIVNLVGDA